MAEQTKSYYAVIPANVRYDKELPANAKLLYGEITALTNEKGYCWATNEYFANLYGVSNRTIINWINSLVDKEYLVKDIIYKDDSKQIVDRYLRLPPSEKNFTTSRKNLHDPSEKNFTTPSEKNFTYNNTISNNTINTTYERESIGQSPTPVPQNKRFQRPNFEKDNGTKLGQCPDIISISNSNSISNNNSSIKDNNIDIIKEIIDYLNNKAQTSYKYNSSNSKKHISARLNEKYTIEDFNKVIDNKCLEWLGTDFEKFLRPETLFGSKFESYLNQKTNVRKTKEDDFMDRYEIKQQQILKSLENE